MVSFPVMTMSSKFEVSRKW